MKFPPFSGVPARVCTRPLAHGPFFSGEHGAHVREREFRGVVRGFPASEFPVCEIPRGLKVLGELIAPPGAEMDAVAGDDAQEAECRPSTDHPRIAAMVTVAGDQSKENLARRRCGPGAPHYASPYNESAKEEGVRQILAMTQALPDENRLGTLAALEHGERCVREITELLEPATTTVSKHLSLLYHAGLVGSRKTGRWVYCTARRRRPRSRGPGRSRLDPQVASGRPRRHPGGADASTIGNR